MSNEDSFEFDVALSFAGEDRAYVEAVATELKAKGIKVFYDSFEQGSLWGKDLVEHLSEVYAKQARFCVMFVSDDYAKKAWTTVERRAAFARAFAERREYILPARFDATEIPGLNKTVGHLDLSKFTPSQLAAMIIEKIQSSATRPAPGSTAPTPILESPRDDASNRSGRPPRLKARVRAAVEHMADDRGVVATTFGDLFDAAGGAEYFGDIHEALIHLQDAGEITFFSDGYGHARDVIVEIRLLE